jgi:hypothetical protein
MGSSVSDNEYELLSDLAPDYADAGERVCFLPEAGLNSNEIFHAIRNSLATHQLVFHPCSSSSPVLAELLGKHQDSCEPKSERQQALSILSPGFSNIVVLDVAAGLDDKGNFSLSDFYVYALKQFVTAFGILAPESFHEEDISQILKDESNSLLCLLNVQVAASLERKRLRCLAQEGHKTLVVYQGTAKEKSLNRSDESPFISARNLKITVIQGPHSRVFFNLALPIIIGRHPDCDICLDQTSASRQHASLHSDGDHVILTNLAVSNGTLLNGNLIVSSKVRSGDTCSISSCLLLLEDSSITASPSVARAPSIEDDFDDEGTVVDFPTDGRQ